MMPKLHNLLVQNGLLRLQLSRCLKPKTHLHLLGSLVLILLLTPVESGTLLIEWEVKHLHSVALNHSSKQTSLANIATLLQLSYA